MSRHEEQEIPSVRGGWLRGSLPEFSADMLGFLQRVQRECGPIGRFRLGPRSLILLSEPDLIEEVLVHKNRDFRKHYATRLLSPVLGKGLLLNEGDSWLRQRRLIQPAFSRRFSEDFANTVRGQFEGLMSDWQRAPRRDLYHDMTALTVNVAASAFLGVEETGQVDAIGDSLEVIHSDFERRFQRPWSLPPPLPTPANRRLRLAVRRLTDVIDELIRQRHSTADRGDDALSRLIRATDDQGQSMSHQLLRDEVMTLLLAGHDTTANALTWTLTLLADHPQHMRAIRDEAGNGDGMESRNADGMGVDLAQLPRTLQVVKEGMRLYPPAYMIGREALRDVDIGGKRINRGASVIMSPWLTHRDPKWFNAPESFLPERWSEEAEKSLHRYAYFPFGGGPRICIGQNVAMIEAVTVIAMAVSRFDLEMGQRDAVKPWPTVTLRPDGPVAVEVRPINRPSQTGVPSRVDRGNRNADGDMAGDGPSGSENRRPHVAACPHAGGHGNAVKPGRDTIGSRDTAETMDAGDGSVDASRSE